MRLHIRYEMKDEKGETRRQRNTRFGVPTPSIDVPWNAKHIWAWFWQLSPRRRSGPEALTYAEVGEWQRLTDTPARPEEIEIIMKMDDAFLSEVGKEQAAAMERQKDKMSRGG